MDQFFQANAWGILVGGIGLLINSVMIYATVKASIAEVKAETKRNTDRLDGHSGRLDTFADRMSKVERDQAERMGYERAMKELRGAE